MIKIRLVQRLMKRVEPCLLAHSWAVSGLFENMVGAFVPVKVTQSGLFVFLQIRGHSNLGKYLYLSLHLDTGNS
jgi:hypothetical protein